jgi:dihydrofolate reductase
MRKIILTMQASLDGIVSDVDQWMTLNDEIIKDSLDYYETLDAIIVGGKTYPGLATYWQEAEKSSESGLERKFAKKINKIEKIVVSRSEVDLVWKNSRLLPVQDDESVVREVKKLKNSEGNNISVESGLGAWQLFIQKDLFDEIWIFVHPVVVGKGEQLFENVQSKISLNLARSKQYENGVVGLYYRKCDG